MRGCSAGKAEEQAVSCRFPRPVRARRLTAALAACIAVAAAIGQAARAFVLPRFGIDQYVRSVSAVYDRFLIAKGLA